MDSDWRKKDSNNKWLTVLPRGREEPPADQPAGGGLLLQNLAWRQQTPTVILPGSLSGNLTASLESVLLSGVPTLGIIISNFVSHQKIACWTIYPGSLSYKYQILLFS